MMTCEDPWGARSARPQRGVEPRCIRTGIGAQMQPRDEYGRDDKEPSVHVTEATDDAEELSNRSKQNACLGRIAPEEAKV